jgi:hypothetical protein
MLLPAEREAILDVMAWWASPRLVNSVPFGVIDLGVAE